MKILNARQGGVCISQGSLEKQNRLDVYIYIGEIYYKGLTHAVMEAEKFHNLPWASRRPRKAVGVFQYESKGLRARRAEGKERSTSQLKPSGRKS